MTTKTITLRAIDLISGVGNEHDGVPFRWLTSLVEKVRAQVPDDEEASCKVRGAAGLTFTFDHILTPTEQMQDELAAMRAKLDAVAGLRHPDGTLVPDAAERLARILGKA